MGVKKSRGSQSGGRGPNVDRQKVPPSNPQLNTTALSKLSYISSVSRAEASVATAAKEMIAAGLLASEINVEELTKRAFAHLDGVTDEWIEKTEVEKVAGGQTPPATDGVAVASASSSKADASCCAMPISN
jgi:sulfonate transport system substrate-binding protein